MKYFLAIFFPPLAVLFYVGFWQAVLNVIFLIVGVGIGGIIHAIIVINAKDREKSEARLLNTLIAGQQIQAAQMQQMLNQNNQSKQQ